MCFFLVKKMLFKIGCFLIMLVVGSIAFPLNEEKDMSFFFDSPVNPLIIGGVVAAEPVAHMVGLTSGIFVKSLFCGGSIINEHFVLSAAHCIRGVLIGNVLTSSLRGNLGSNRWSTSIIEHQFSRGINHPDYDDYLIKNDLGFLVTTTAIVFTDSVQPIALNFNFIEGGAPAIANGWGRIIVGGTVSQHLMELRPVTIDGQTCISEVARVGATQTMEFPHVDPEVELCTFLNSSTGMCHGDSGSALVLAENNQQIGVVSWGVPCGVGAPDMFVRVSAYKSWIEQQLM